MFICECGGIMLVVAIEEPPKHFYKYKVDI